MTTATATTGSSDLSELADALRRLNEYSAKLTKDRNVIAGAYDPIKDMLQVTSQVHDLLQAVDWSKISSNLCKPEISVNSLKELNEIQSASLRLWADASKENVDYSFASEQKCIGELKEIKDPASFAATMINLGIDQLEGFNSRLAKQSENTLRIKAAYMAWWQKTLQALTA